MLDDRPPQRIRDRANRQRVPSRDRQGTVELERVYHLLMDLARVWRVHTCRYRVVASLAGNDYTSALTDRDLCMISGIRKPFLPSSNLATYRLQSQSTAGEP